MSICRLYPVLVKMSGLAMLLLTGACATHLPSDRVAVVFGKPITYGAVEPGGRVPVVAGGMAAIIPANGETTGDRARRCGWSERDLELQRFRHFFLLYFRQGYISRIGAGYGNMDRSAEPHVSRLLPRGSGFSVVRFILAADGDDGKAVVVVPRPDADEWWINKALYAKHGGRVSKRHGWLPIDALRREVGQLEQSGEIGFFDKGYRRRFWRYFDGLDAGDLASRQDSEEYFRAPWWTRPLPATAARQSPPVPRKPSPLPCTPP